jgi:hypothetical protein
VSVETVFDTLDPAMARWTMGGQAAAAAPAAWQGVLVGQVSGEQELRLLALAGQYLSLCVAPSPATALTAITDIPSLTLPLLAEPDAALARRCLKAMKDSAAQRDLVHLLAARGYAIHPADWMPGRNDDAVPDVYAPWRDWTEAHSAQGGITSNAHDELTEANWHDWWPATRRVALNELRTRDPARATALLATKAGGEAAEARLRLIECLMTRLSDADVPYLESLSQDRAPKIKAFAASMLARLGRGADNTEDALELAAFFEFQTKGLLRRTRILVPRTIKTPAQRSRRETLLAQVDYIAFARALDVSPDDLVALWPLGADAPADYGFALMLEQSASSAIIDAISARLIQENTKDISFIIALRERLDTGRRGDLARRVLASTGGSFQAVTAIAGPGSEMDGLIETASGKALLAAVKGESDFSTELQALALLASQSSARSALDRMTHAGLTPSDPRLDLLRLNAALDHSGAQA